MAKSTDRQRRFRPHGEWATTPKSTVRPVIRDLAWAAGFMEGEGCFTHTGTAERIQASQVNREPLERLQRLFGGRITTRHNRRGFGLFHRGVGICSHWTANSARARGIAMTLYAFMSARRQEQIRVMLKKFKSQNRKVG